VKPAADEFRRSGVSGAATQAQARADKKYEEANRKPEGFLEWLFDVAFNSWLNSGRQVKAGRPLL
jgi:hypothetical protein